MVGERNWREEGGGRRRRGSLILLECFCCRSIYCPGLFRDIVFGMLAERRQREVLLKIRLISAED
jgi:hypothetical protein